MQGAEKTFHGVIMNTHRKQKNIYVASIEQEKVFCSEMRIFTDQEIFQKL